MPQSLQFNLSTSRDCESLADFTKSLRPSRIEILDPANVPFRLLDLLLTLKVPYDIFVADAGLLGPPNTQPCATAVRSVEIHEIGQHTEPTKTNQMLKGTDSWDCWQKVANGAQRILVPCPEAEAFAASVLPQGAIDKIDRVGKRHSSATRKRRHVVTYHLGLVPVRSCAHEQWLMQAIACRFGTMRPEVAITVIGTALDDMSLMRSGNAFVTGAVNADEFRPLADSLGLGYLFTCTTRPLFGHPIVSAALSSSLPTAYFDWSMGHIRPKKKDLPIDPHSTLDDIISALSRWMPGS